MNRYIRSCHLILFVFLGSFMFLSFLFPDRVCSQENEINWIEGPNTVTLDKNIAQVTIGEEYVFANGNDTRKIMEAMGNPATNTEVGSIFPKDFEQGWFVIFDYEAVGYIKDDEKHSIDAEALLESIKEGTEQSNKKRKEMGAPAFHVTGWYEKPHYDENNHNLLWAITGRAENAPEGVEIVNHNVRLLGRQGYTSVVMVSERSVLDKYKPDVDKIIANFSYTKGKSYAEYVQGDKVAQYGLTALIAGGAAAAATKFGFFKFIAKAWKFIAIAVAGFFAAIRKKIKSIFSRKDSDTSEV